MGKVMRALGLMSGTSMDGIDVALIDTDGEDILTRGPFVTVPYPDDTRARLVQGLADARNITNDRMARPGSLAVLETEITQLHGQAVTMFLAAYGLKRSEIDLVGFHGQTVVHRPWVQAKISVPQAKAALDTPKVEIKSDEGALTVQLGDGVALAKLIGIDVVHDMRAADVAAGGQGAPLVPVYHRALAARLPQRPLAIVNIGGVANVTVIARDGNLTAFDTGPGNALIDDWMMKRVGISFDAGGETAAKGTVNEDVLRFYLGHSFFADPPPKSLDRNAFFSDLVDWMSVEDGTATLTAFTAGSIARAREHMHEEPALWVIAGGGRKNATLMSMIASRVENAVVPAEAVGLSGDALEAEAWAYLAVRSLRGLPLTFPGTTGVTAPTTGGIFSGK